MKRRQILWIAIVFEGGLVVLAWGLGALLGTPPVRGLQFTGTAVGWGLLAGVPLLVGLVGVARTPWPPFVRLKRRLDDIVAELFASCTVIDLAVISALAGIGEEALFRGVMQTGLAGVVGLWTAVAVTSVVFGLAHYVSLTYAVYATVVGFYLGLLLVVFDNLLVPVVTHAAYDFIALTYMVYLRARPDGEGGGSSSQKRET